MALGGIIGAALNLGQGLINNQYQESYNADARDFSRESATTAYERQKELLRLNQDYTSPGHQLALYTAAGINPNLLLNGSLGSIPTSASSVSAAPAPNTASRVLNNDYVNAALANAQISRLSNQSENESKLTDADVRQKLADVNLKDVDSERVLTAIREINSQIALNKASLDYQETLNSEEEIRLTNLTVDLIKRSTYIEDEFKAYESSLGLTRKEYEFLCASFALRLRGLQLNNSHLATEIGLNQKEIARMNVFLKYADAVYKAESQSAVADAAISGYDAELKQEFGTYEKVLDMLERVVDGGTNVYRSVRTRGVSRGLRR